ADRRDRQHAGAHGLPVEVHGAGAALRHAASELRPGEPQDVTKHPQQRHVRGRVHLARRPVDVESHQNLARGSAEGRGSPRLGRCAMWSRASGETSSDAFVCGTLRFEIARAARTSGTASAKSSDVTPKKQAIPAILALWLAAGVARASTEAPK